MFYIVLFCSLLVLVIILAIIVKVITIGIKDVTTDKTEKIKTEKKHIDEKA